LGNSSKGISMQFVSSSPLRAWPLRALRLGEKPSFGAVLVAVLEPKSHRKGAKDAKGNSQGSDERPRVGLHRARTYSRQNAGGFSLR
jgi:hypothetical protein